MSSNLQEKPEDTQVEKNTKVAGSDLVSDVKEIEKDTKEADGETQDNAQKNPKDDLPKAENKAS